MPALLHNTHLVYVNLHLVGNNIASIMQKTIIKTQLEMNSDSDATDLVPAEQKSEVGLGPSHDSWASGWRLPTDSDELLPSRPVRTFNLRAERSPLGGAAQSPGSS